MLIAEVIIPQMFTAYAEDLGYLDNGLHHIQYFCEQCDQAFTSAWGRKTGCLNWCERGNYFYCPNCNTKHEKNVVYIKRQVQAPNKIRLSVKAHENVVILDASSNTVYFSDLLRVYSSKYKESFRFDLAKQTVLFTNYHNRYEIESLEIGNLFKLDVFNKSILRFFQPASLANSGQKSELNRLLKVLRENVHGKLEKHLGHRIPSMFVSPGRHHGTFLLPILNIAYRVQLPDAPNLATIYRERIDTIQRFWQGKMINDCSFMDEVIKCKTDFVTALVKVKSLPDRPVVRKILSETPFEINLLTEAFALCQNYDYAIRLYSGFRNLSSERCVNEDLLKFLRNMLPFYDEAGIVQLVETEKETELWDCIRLYQQLSVENREAIKTDHVRLRDLHDWMALRHRKQTHINLKFNVPDHIVRRLSMQTNQLKFFMPEESMQLLEAGVALHNCVASYGSAMKDNTKWVVLMADDKGKLAACLEVQGKKLVQAKLDKNRPISNDARLNAEVLAWAKEASLEIKTTDLKIETEEMISKAV